MTAFGQFHLICDGALHHVGAITVDNVQLFGALSHIGSSVVGLNPSLAVCRGMPSTAQLLVAEVYAPGVGVNREIVSMPVPGLIDLIIEAERPQILSCDVILNIDAGRLETTEIIRTSQTRFSVGTTTYITGKLGSKIDTDVTIRSLSRRYHRHLLHLDIGFGTTTSNAYLGGQIPGLVHQLHRVVRFEESGNFLSLEVAPHGATNRIQLRLEINGDEPAYRGQALAGRQDVAGHRVYELSTPDPVNIHVSCEVMASDSSLSAAGDPVRYSGWNERWSDLGARIFAIREPKTSVGFRYAQFQLLQHGLPHSYRSGRISSARGLTSTYHSGASFFDTELHKCAYWTWTCPEVALRYLQSRLHDLPEAQRYAALTGFRGARYPEATNDLGAENGPHYVLSYPERSVYREKSVEQVLHISADICFAMSEYIAVTGNHRFLADGGWRVAIEASRFAASAFHWSEEKHAYRILQVMGPDEYHYDIDDNYYTNYICGWSMKYALDILGSIEAARSAVSKVEEDEWRHIVERIYLPNGIVNGVQIPEQFEGYFDLPDTTLRRGHDIAGPRFVDCNESALAARLEKFPNQAIKQADIILLMTLFPDEFTREVREQAVAYYEPRTVHDSSLSYGPYGVTMARLGDANTAAKLLTRASRYNLDFSPSTGYTNGLHLSAYAGAWQILATGLGGARIRNGRLCLGPIIPDAWEGYEFAVVTGGNRQRIAVTREEVRIYADRPDSVDVSVDGGDIPVGVIKGWK